MKFTEKFKIKIGEEITFTPKDFKSTVFLSGTEHANCQLAYVNNPVFSGVVAGIVDLGDRECIRVESHFFKGFASNPYLGKGYESDRIKICGDEIIEKCYTVETFTGKRGHAWYIATNRIIAPSAPRYGEEQINDGHVYCPTPS